MTDELLQKLHDTASRAAKQAYVPYSKYRVGAALMDDKGNIYGGCNVEIANYKGVCAEATAITQMILGGARIIRDIVVLGPGTDLCTPCGDCRQRIREFSDAQTRIHSLNHEGVLLKTYTMAELLPDSFGPENLQR